ncbi:unnamed protein product, partial [Coregonus sp. 'balchen']
GLGTDEDTLVEILASRTNKEIKEIKKAYKEEYKNELENDIKSETGGDFSNALLSLCKATRNEDTIVNQELADSDAKALYEAGEKKKGTDCSVFIDILTTRSAPQLRQEVLQVHECAGSKPAFFAERLNLAMKGKGTWVKILTRVMVSRSEVDMVRIKQEYKKTFGKTLYQEIL